VSVSSATDACPRCATRVDAEEGSCPQCGLRVFCPVCGGQYADPLSDRFCGTCGEAVRRDEDASREEDGGGAGAGSSTSAVEASEGAPSRPARRTKVVVGTIVEKGKAGAGRAHREVRRSAWWQTRSGEPRSAAELRLALCLSLLTGDPVGDIEAEAERLLEQALAESVRDAGLLNAVARRALIAHAGPLAVRAFLELALMDPAQATSCVQAVTGVIDSGVASRCGGWIVSTWLPAIRTQTSGSSQAACALLAWRVSLLLGDPDTALLAFAEAAQASEERARAAIEQLLLDESTGSVLPFDKATTQIVLAKSHAALKRFRDAVRHADTALAVGGIDGAAELTLLELRADWLVAAAPDKEAAGALLQLGQRYDQAGRHANAVQRFRQAADIDGENAISHWYLADSLRLTSERPSYPYVDPAAIAEARAHWERGLSLAAPEPSQPWVYLTGALIDEWIAYSGEDVGGLLERSALHAELAAALDDGSADAWALAGRYQRMLQNLLTADHSVRRALELDAENRSAAWERVVIAVEQAALDAARQLEVYSVRYAAEPTHRVLGLRAHHLIVEGDYPAARAALRACLVADAGNLWALSRLALCHALLDDAAASCREATEVLDVFAAGASHDGNLQSDERALSLLLAGRAGEARAVYEAAVAARPRGPIGVRMGLAVAAWRQGAHGESIVHAQGAVGMIACRGDAGIVLGYVRLLERWDPEAAVALRPLADTAAAQWASRRPVAQTIDDVHAELDATIRASESGSPMWLAAMAAKGRILADAGQWDEADAVDRELCELAEPAVTAPAVRHRIEVDATRAFAEAETRRDVPGLRRWLRRLRDLNLASAIDEPLTLARVLLADGDHAGALQEARRAERGTLEADEVDHRRRRSALILQGDVLLAERRWGDARSRYVEALQAEDDDLDDDGKASIEVRLGIVAAQSDSVVEALEHLGRAFVTKRAESPPKVSAAFVMNETARLLGGQPEPAALVTALRGLIELASLSGPERRRLASARFAMRRASTDITSNKPVDEIAIEGGRGLLPAERAEELASEAIPALRHDLRAATGVRIPGVRVLMSPLLPDWGYRLSINEIPYALGTVPEAARLSRAQPSSAPGVMTVNAWSGERAWWVDGGPESGVQPAHLGVLWLLGGLLRARMAEFVALAELDYRINAWVSKGGAERTAVVEAAIPSSRARTRLVVVLRRLVRQQIPVNDLGRMLSAIAPIGDGSIARLVEAIRAELVDTLPPNGEDRDVVTLDADLQAAIRRLGRGARRSEVGVVLGGLARAIEGRAPGQIVVAVDDTVVRVPTQRLCERLLPSVAVLSQRELQGLPDSAIP
jgi:tetratricopeptide (TPR) repeat protein